MAKVPDVRVYLALYVIMGGNLAQLCNYAIIGITDAESWLAETNSGMAQSPLSLPGAGAHASYTLVLGGNGAGDAAGGFVRWLLYFLPDGPARCLHYQR